MRLSSPRIPGIAPGFIRATIPIAGLLVAQLGFAPAPVAAAAPSVVIAADQPAAVPKGENWAFNDFFPRSVTVAQGTTIGFVIEGFHTATLLPAGTTTAQDLATNGVLTSDTDDTAPNPNGTTHSIFRLPSVGNLPATGCGTDANPCSFDGTSVVSAGAPLGPPSGPPTPFDVTINAAPGIYAFHCRVHPLMTASLTVVAAGATVPSQADVQAAVSAQIKADVQAGQTAKAQASNAGVKHNADGTTSYTLTAGTSDPDGRTVILEFLPDKLKIKPGDSVTWIPRGTNEPHTVTFPTDIHTDQVPMCENGSTDTPAVPTVNPPTGPQDFACGSGPADEIELSPGNGVSTVTSPATVADSGTIAPPGVPALFGVPATAALTSWTASFAGAVAGTYHYICQIHGAPMEATITVIGPQGPKATPPATDVQTPTGNGNQPAPVAPALAVLAGLALLSVGALRLRALRSR